MKVSSWLLVFTCLLISNLFAQTTASNPSTSTTKTGSTTVVSNRQQELYDQYHGYNKKAAATSVTTIPVATSADTPVASKKTTTKVATSSTAKADDRIQEKSQNPPIAQPASTARVDAPRQPESIEGNPSSRFRIGVRGGVTYPFYLEKNALIDPTLGFVGGVTFTLGTGAVSFQPEVNYVRNSAKVNYFGVTSTQAIDFIQVPLLLKFSSGSYMGSRFFFHVGPYASYALSGSIDGKKYSLDGTPGRFGFGGAVGIGAAIKAGPGHVTFEVRGLYPLGDTDSGFNTNSRTIFGQGTLGYMFPLGGGR